MAHSVYRAITCFNGCCIRAASTSSSAASDSRRLQSDRVAATFRTLLWARTKNCRHRNGQRKPSSPPWRLCPNPSFVSRRLSLSPLSHSPTFPLSHFPTFPLSHFPTFPLSHFPTFPLSHFPTFPLSRLSAFPAGYPSGI